METLKVRIHNLVEVHEERDTKNQIFDCFDWFIISLVLLNIVAVIAETVDSFAASFQSELHYFELFSVIIFTIEYLLRLWSCTVLAKYSHPIWGRLRFASTPLLIIDLLSFLPFFFPTFGLDLRFLRIIQLLRTAKLIRYSKSIQYFVKVIKNHGPDLISGLILITILLILSSSLLYIAERNAQPDKFSSIPATMWWAIATITTVGYGDIFPITVPGKILAALSAICGILLFALPAGIIGAAFIEEMRQSKRSKVCPYCKNEEKQ